VDVMRTRELALGSLDEPQMWIKLEAKFKVFELEEFGHFLHAPEFSYATIGELCSGGIKEYFWCDTTDKHRNYGIVRLHLQCTTVIQCCTGE